MNGRTTLQTRALQRLAVAIVCDASGVPAQRVSVRLADDSGYLRVAVELPAVVPSADPPRNSTDPDASQAFGFADQGSALRGALVARMAELADRRVRAVDVRLTGVYRAKAVRVQ